MANEVTNTEAAAMIPESWEREIVEYLYDSDSAFNRVLNKVHTGPGDIVNISTEPVLTAQTVGADGVVTVNTPTLGAVVLTIGRHKAIVLEWLKSTKLQTMPEWWNSLPRGAGNALKEEMEAALLALHADITTNHIDLSAEHIGSPSVYQAIGMLLRGKLPILKNPEEFTFVFDGVEYEYLKALDFKDYSRTGQPGDGGAAVTDIARLCNIPTILTNQVATSGGANKNYLFHKTAFAQAVQENLDLEYASGLANRALTRLFSADVFYGVKTVLQARAVKISTKDG